MKILFDQGTPVPLRRHLIGHEIGIAFELGWSCLENGDLLRAAESAGFDVFITTDQNLRHQQNLTGRRLAILVLLSTDWRLIERHIDLVRAAVVALMPGAYVEVPLGRPRTLS